MTGMELEQSFSLRVVHYIANGATIPRVCLLTMI